MKTGTLIANPTAPNLEALGASLVLSHGCAPVTGRVLCFDCPDQVADALIECGAAQVAQALPTYDAERAWLKAYAGDFEFYVSLKAQLARKGDLSPKQWEAVTRAVERDRQRAEQALNPPAPQTFSLLPGTVLRLTRFIAEKIAEQAGCSRAHFAFEVLEVKRETERAYLAVVRMSAVKCAVCCVCGLQLKNPVSISLGIGPECGKHWGVGQEPDALEALASKLREFKTVETWIPKKSIKERIEKV